MDEPIGPSSGVDDVQRSSRTRTRSSSGRVRRRMARRLFVDVAGGPRRTVLVAGSGRSGTTWLGELLTRGSATRYVFEPLHPRLGPFPGEFPRTYARPGSAFDDEEAWARILSGRVRHPWVDQYAHAFLPRRRVVKD